MYDFKCSDCQKEMELQVSTESLTKDRFCEKCGGKLVHIPKTIRVTTYSGAIYVVEGNKVAGGSKNLKGGTLLYPVRCGDSMLISAPERGHLNPDFKNPSVLSTPVVKIEPI